MSRRAWKPWLVVLLGSALLVTVVLGRHITPTSSPGVLAQSEIPLKQAFPKSRICEGCHVRSFDEWSATAHAQSIHSSAFRALLKEYRAFAQGGDAGFCFRCHAPHLTSYPSQLPEAVSQVDSGSVEFDGIGCTQCHLVDALEAKSPPPALHFSPGRTMFGPYGDAVSNLAHKSQQVDLFKDSQFCLSCHQPAPMGHASDADVDLIGPWPPAGTASEGRACQDCHMPAQFGESANGQRKRMVFAHGFSGPARSRRLAAAIVTVEPRVEGTQTTLTVTLENQAPHRLPSAHPGWASLVLDVEIKGKNLKTVFQEQRKYRRVYLTAEGEPTVFDFAAARVQSDTTLTPLEVRTETFTFPTPEDAPSFDAVVTLSYGPIEGPASLLDKVRDQTQVTNKSPWDPVTLVTKRLNVPLR